MSIGSSFRTRFAPFKLVAISGGARLATLPVTLILNLVLARHIISHVRTDQYGVVLLVTNFAALIPFADLGIGAPVMSQVAASKNIQSDVELHKVLRSAQRVLFRSAGIATAVSAALYITHAWQYLLGSAATKVYQVQAVATVVLILLALALAFSIGTRILIGMGKNHTVVLSAVVTSAGSILIALLITKLSIPGAWYAVSLPGATLITNLWIYALTARSARCGLWRIMGEALNPLNKAAVSLRRQAVPMLIISIATPVSLQTDRIILSHRSSATALTQYGVCYQIYAPLFGLAFAAATPLWPIAARRRADQLPLKSTWRLATAAFAFAGLLFATTVVVAGPEVVRWVTHGTVAVPASLYVAFGSLLLIQLLFLPTSMFMTTNNGLRVQALLAVIAACGNFALSWLLASGLGAKGPIVASIVFTGALQILPGAWYFSYRDSAVPGKHSERAADRLPID